jgi:hypothetical protein
MQISTIAPKKTLLCLVLVLGAVPGSAAGAGQSAPPQAQAAPQDAALITFDLDFPGGTPGDLVAAIQNALGRPLNAIVLPDHSDEKLPPLKMNGVNVSQLFDALRAASRKAEVVATRRGGLQHLETERGFKTDGKPSNASIWYFYVHNAGQFTEPEQKISRFYLLTPFLDRGLTVDDITTAIQTGWKMLGDSASAPASMSFHQETNLLIAVGEAHQLETIDQVLNALYPPQPRPVSGAVGKPAEQPKPEQ